MSHVLILDFVDYLDYFFQFTSDVCKHRCNGDAFSLSFFYFRSLFRHTVASWKLGMSHSLAVEFVSVRDGLNPVFPQNYERYRFANNSWRGLMSLLPHTTAVHYGIGQCGRHSEERAFLQCLRRADPHYVRINSVHVKITSRYESLLK